jgi:hypothetical protein
MLKATTFSVLMLGAALLMLAQSGGASEKRMNCDKVMRELVNGKSAEEVAKILKVPVSAIYDCEGANAAEVRGIAPSRGNSPNRPGARNERGSGRSWAPFPAERVGSQWAVRPKKSPYLLEFLSITGLNNRCFTLRLVVRA